MNNDLISREDLKKDFMARLEKAKKWKENALNKCDDELVIRATATIDFICEVIMTINNAPTPKAEDDTPTGTWIPEEETYTDLSGTIETYTRFKCDNCMQGQNFGPYPFCPWCGKKKNPEIRKDTKDGT